MDKALASRSGRRCLTPDWTEEDFFSVWKKFKFVLLSPWVPHHVLSLSPNVSFLLEFRVNLLGGDKRECNVEKS